MISIDFAGYVALVTGASAGIGQASARALARAGASVIVVARRREPLDELAAEFDNGQVTVIEADVTATDAPHTLSDAVHSQGRLDVLVNCAGGSRTVALDADEDQWREAMELNFGSLRRLTHALLPFLIASERGRVITVTGSSEPARNPVFAGSGQQSALNASNSAKAAVHAWAKGLSREVGRHGVTVNSVAPGTILTEQLARIFPTEELRARHVDELDIPIGRFGDPSELASAVLFLASPLAGYITGEIIHVDGGKRKHAF